MRSFGFSWVLVGFAGGRRLGFHGLSWVLMGPSHKTGPPWPGQFPPGTAHVLLHSWPLIVQHHSRHTNTEKKKMPAASRSLSSPLRDRLVKIFLSAIIRFILSMRRASTGTVPVPVPVRKASRVLLRFTNYRANMKVVIWQNNSGLFATALALA